ncbi:hypothetical protein [Bradyrhizobium japonicum]|uniref:hypothetical protein n=1 Tax=Bradyrhizobium japonicum TaxID=375 RepID=UPI00271523AD|nr:hypothetical protein [Bradyrhizobium japonicum]WLB18852.1 hypothetical protein QIH95_44165 [Bradyrhizobium japonicum]
MRTFGSPKTPRTIGSARNPSNEYVSQSRRRRFDSFAIRHLCQILNPAKMQNIPEIPRSVTLQALKFTHSIPRRPKIKILGHTGRSIVAPIDRFAAGREAAGIDRRVEIQILLRDKGAESPRRRAQIIFAEEHANSLIQKYPWLKIEVRYYSALQTLRGTIVRLADGSKRALFSAYEWTLKPQPIQG